MRRISVPVGVSLMVAGLLAGSCAQKSTKTYTIFGSSDHPSGFASATVTVDRRPTSSVIFVTPDPNSRSTLAVLRQLGAQGLRPANAKELFEHADRLPVVCSVVALETMWVGNDGRSYTVYARRTKDNQLLSSITAVDRDWDQGSCFAAVKQSTSLGEHVVVRVAVDYSLPLQTMIASGNYENVSPRLLEQTFPATAERKTDLDLVVTTLNRVGGLVELLKELRRHRLRPATLPELLAVGEQHPDLQRRNPIVALGSVWRSPNGLEWFPLLTAESSGESASRRVLAQTSDLGYDWSYRMRFAAVKIDR